MQWLIQDVSCICEHFTSLLVLFTIYQLCRLHPYLFIYLHVSNLINNSQLNSKLCYIVFLINSLSLPFSHSNCNNSRHSRRIVSIHCIKEVNMFFPSVCVIKKNMVFYLKAKILWTHIFFPIFGHLLGWIFVDLQKATTKSEGKRIARNHKSLGKNLFTCAKIWSNIWPLEKLTFWSFVKTYEIHLYSHRNCTTYKIQTHTRNIKVDVSPPSAIQIVN